jgi:glycosyltransferase involved in cell wall biosynthesis
MILYFEELNTAQRMGGIETATRGLVAHLAKAGLKVTRSSEGTSRELPDCVHLHGIWSPQLARRFLAWRKRGVPCVVSPHGMLEPWALSHKRVKKVIAWHLYQRRLLDQATVLHGTSERETAQFKILGLRPPTAMVPWGVSLPQVRERAAKHCPQIALFVGRIYPVKGLPMLIEAWARVHPAGWKLRIVGPDQAGHQAEVEAVVRKAGVASVVEFTGELTGPTKEAAYEEADLFVLPSYTENFGIAIAEALAHALPVVTTTGTPWASLNERGCGWWVAPTVHDVAKALSTATALDDETLRAMGAKGREWVLNDFNWQQTANRMKELYLWVLGEKPKPSFVKFD